MGRVRATVIIPTFGDALFSRWAIRSVRAQTVRDIEICIICDGSPQTMVTFFQEMKQEDSRIQVYSHAKSPRTGEPYRDTVIKQTSGRIICYCSHDDLWFPCHIAEMEKQLRRSPFGHSIHAYVNLPENIKDDNSIIEKAFWINVNDPDITKRMMDGENFFGLTFAAHTRKAYKRLKEGWVTTPKKDLPTDLYMWQKFLSAYGPRCRSVTKITALHFLKAARSGWSEQQRDDELRLYFEKMRDQEFFWKVQDIALRFRPLSLGKIAAKINYSMRLRRDRSVKGNKSEAARLLGISRKTSTVRSEKTRSS